MKMVSACLVGCECRYDQQAKTHETAVRLLQDGAYIPVCPEQLGGLPTPRLPAEIVGGDGYDVLDGRARVIDREQNDVTELYLKGARQALLLAKRVGATEALLKEFSPTCGSQAIYDGTFSGSKKSGIGVLTALFLRNGIKVVSDTALE